MTNEKTLKEKKFSFLPTRKEEKQKAAPQMPHLFCPDTQANASAKSKEPFLANPHFLVLLDF